MSEHVIVKMELRKMTEKGAQFWHPLEARAIWMPKGQLKLSTGQEPVSWDRARIDTLYFVKVPGWLAEEHRLTPPEDGRVME